MAETEFAPTGSEGLAVPEDFGVQHVTDAASYEKVKPGTVYIDPGGQRKTKPYRIKPGSHASSEYAALPENVPYIDPEGVSRVTPKYEDLDFTTQTLFNMSATDAERKNSLERGYPGKVKENKETGELYVEDEGVRRRSRGFGKSPGAFIASQALPVAGAVGGGIVGTGAGLPGSVAGTFWGSAAGQALNDSILALAGVYDRSPLRETGELAASGASAVAGELTGAGLAAIGPTAKAVVTKGFPWLVSAVLGTDKAGVETALKIKAKDPNVKIPISSWSPEAAHFANINEVFDPAYRLQDPMRQSQVKYYEAQTGKLLKDLGIEPPESISDLKAAVPTQKAGEIVLARTTADLQKADAELAAKLAAHKAAAEAGTLPRQTSAAEITKAADAARAKAQAVIDEGFRVIQGQSDAAMAAAKAGHNSGDLWWRLGESLKAARAGIMARADKMYDTADTLAGDILPKSAGLPETAKAFLMELPENMSGQYPQIVKRISEWAGKMKTDGSGWEVEPITPTWSQLRKMRTALRQNYNRFDLTPDVKQGTFKYFANRVNEIINDAKADPRLVAASQQLRATDKFYHDNMGPLQDRRIQAVMDGLESGLPADPKILFNTIVKEGRSDLTKHIEKLVGPNLWAGVKAADVKEMLDQSKSIVPGQIDGRRFVQEVLERHRSGTLEAVHGKEVSTKLIKQAQTIAALDGKIDMPVNPGDTLKDVIDRARFASEAAEKAADKDPIGTLAREIRSIEIEHKAKLAKQRRNDPLGFLYDMKIGATAAIDKIIGSEDLYLAAATRFGENSPEFTGIRQIMAQRILTGTIRPHTRLPNISEEVQRMTFPGVTMANMKEIASEMEFLMGLKTTGAGSSIAATEHVEHPFGVLGPLGKPIHAIPFAAPIGRLAVGNYFKFITFLVNRPVFMKLALKGLDGDAQSRAAIKELFQRRIAQGSSLGAAGGEILFQEPTQGRDK